MVDVTTPDGYKIFVQDIGKKGVTNYFRVRKDGLTVLLIQNPGDGTAGQIKDLVKFAAEPKLDQATKESIDDFANPKQ